jgi:hypothetical protein
MLPKVGHGYSVKNWLPQFLRRSTGFPTRQSARPRCPCGADLPLSNCMRRRSDSSCALYSPARFRDVELPRHTTGLKMTTLAGAGDPREPAGGSR